VIAKTDASGGRGLLPEVLAFTTSLAVDRALAREDLAGSLAHLIMLARQGIVPGPDAVALRGALLQIWEGLETGALALVGEEDVHMAVEAELSRRLGEVAGRLHTARSRNDQVALDLRLHVRQACAESLTSLSTLLSLLADRAEAERETILPAYTHRQRAQPISAAYWLCGYGAMFARDAETLAAALGQADVLPLGVGAIAGTSLPIDRELPRRLLSFARISANGLDTVGDRDFELDFAYAAARCLLHASRLATDVIDFASAEFGLLKLDGAIACGSSLMPQKRNPDVFELVRGKAGVAIGNLMGLLAIVKGLPGGYNRDLQEDRPAALGTGALLRGSLDALVTALPRVSFDVERCRAAVAGDYMQATDLAEALVRKGLPFRTAYLAVGTLVSRCQERQQPLAAATLELAQGIHPAFDAAVLAIASSPLGSAGRKTSAGGTGPESVNRQIAALREQAAAARKRAAEVPSIAALFSRLREERL
jgi:argininosuccinate lyase